MSKPKLVSISMGMSLIVERDGQEERKELTMRLPNVEDEQPIDALQALAEFLNNELGLDLDVVYDRAGYVQIAKPKRIKAHRKVTHEEFNKRIAELGG